MIRIGVIGTGGMAHAHANAFEKIKGVKMVACCDINEKNVQAFAEKYKIPAVYTDYRKMLSEQTLDGVTNVTPDHMHAEIAIAVMKKGVAILSEKPLADNLANARKMAAVARKTGVVNVVNFSYRSSSALQKAAKWIADGKIGRVIHVESSYLQGWLTTGCMGKFSIGQSGLWRLSSRHGSLGTLGDIGCHILDMTTLMVGDISDIYCRLETFDKGVPGNRQGEYVFDANDSFVSTVTFQNGAIGTIHSSRWATGQPNSLRVRVYGDKGAIEVDLDKSWTEYRICAGNEKALRKAEWKTIHAGKTPDNYQRFIRCIQTGKQDPSDFQNALKVQAYLHYSMLSDEKKAPARVRV